MSKGTPDDPAMRGGAKADPIWPDYFARLGQADATTWHYQGYLADTQRIWSTYYSLVLVDFKVAFVGMRQFFSNLVSRIWGERAGRRMAPLVAVMTPFFLVSAPLLALVAVAIAPPLLKYLFKRPVPPLFRPFKYMGWVNYCIMLLIVFAWHGYKQHRLGWGPEKIAEHSSKAFWNRFFEEHLPEGHHPTRIYMEIDDGQVTGSIPQTDVVIKPTSGGAGDRLRSMIWDAQREVFSCDDAEKAEHEADTYTPDELDRFLRDNYANALVERFERPRAPLPVSSVRVLTLCIDRQAELICIAFLPAPEGSISTAYFDLDTYLVDYQTWSIAEPLRVDSEGQYTGIELPELREISLACLRMHEELPGHVEVSWDVLLTERGPVYLEGNIFPPGCDYKLTVFKSSDRYRYIRRRFKESLGQGSPRSSPGA